VHHWIRLSRSLVATAAAAGVPAVVTAHDLYATCPRVFRVREGESFCERPLSVASCLHCVPREPWMSDEMVGVQIERYEADLRRELELAAAVVAPSQAHARVLGRFAARPLERITVVPHASLLERQPVTTEAWRPGARPLRLAHWGHLLPFKGPHVLLEAVRALADPGAVEVALWGRADDEGYGARLEALAEGLRVERRVTFSRADLAALRADLAVFPSLAHESHSFVLDEAFALGMPALVSERGALGDRVGAAGAAFPVGDAPALARLLGEVLETPERLAAMRAAVPEPRGFADHWRELVTVYEAARAHRPAAPGRDLEALHGWERLMQGLERRARDLATLHDAAEEEVRGLRKQTAEAWGKLQAAEERGRETPLAGFEGEVARLERRPARPSVLGLPARALRWLWERLRGR
jgi:glycosyltransferase involved in cell wall biosynthesis